MQKNKKHRFDYLFIGTGNSALTGAALLANDGARVLMLEAHDIPGGYAQSFAWGKYYFCGQVHYIWGCEPGGRINSFLRKVGLDKDIAFKLYNPDGYDVMAMPDGKRVPIPYGWHRLVKSVENSYPGQGTGVKKFTDIISRLRSEFLEAQRLNISQKDINNLWLAPKLVLRLIKEAPKLKTIYKYRHATLQDVFDQCGLSLEVQTVLSANAGDFMEPPERLSFFAYISLFSGYNRGAFYPSRHYKYYIGRVAKFIESHRGSRIIYNSEVVKIDTKGKEVVSVKTKDGREFSAQNIICNADPQKMAKIIGMEKFTRAEQKRFNYSYSPSGVMIYLGLKNIDLKKFGFGNHNFWHCENWDMNRMWREQARGDFSKPWVFISTPTLHSKAPGVCPPGHEIMEVASFAEYDTFSKEKKKSYQQYEKTKNKIADRLLEIVEKRYIPHLSKYIDVKVIGSSTTNEDWAWAPRGNAYGASLTPHQMIKRVSMQTSFKNFYFCNASAGFAGMNGTTGNGTALYELLTGKQVVAPSRILTDEQASQWAYKTAKRRVQNSGE